MRRVIVIGIAVVAVVVGGTFAVRGLLDSAARSRDIARLLEKARSLNENDATRSDAIVALEEVLKLDPDNVEAHREIANAYANLSTPRLDKVVEHYEKVVALSKGDAQTRLELAKARVRRYLDSATDEDFKAARAELLELMAVPETDAEATYNYAVLHTAKGKYRDLDKALEKLEQLLKQHPNFEDRESAEALAANLRKALHPETNAKDGG